MLRLPVWISIQAGETVDAARIQNLLGERRWGSDGISIAALEPVCIRKSQASSKAKTEGSFTVHLLYEMVRNARAVIPLSLILFE